MRSFKSILVLAAFVPFLMASSCDPDPKDPVCGDGLCEKGKGETNYACSADCPPVCGDGFCDEAHNEKCTLDCGSDKPPPTLQEFYCGGRGPYTCESLDRYAACCNGTFLTCPAAYPYACPLEGGCFTGPCQSTYNYCSAFAVPCSTSNITAGAPEPDWDNETSSFPEYGVSTHPNFSENVTP